MAMDSKRFTSLLFVFLLAALSNARPTTVADPSSKKVSLALYYETLCPGCAQFTVDHLIKLYEDDDLMEIVDLRLVPFGNAIIVNGSIECQHGEVECFFNTMDACVIDAFPNAKEHFPFVHCLEKIIQEKDYGKLGECFAKLPGVDPEAIMQCTVGDRGLELEFKYAEETKSLQPPHEYVPWVTVNGKPLHDDFLNFIAHICQEYKGPKVPKACSGASMKTTQAGGQKAELKGCGRKELPKLTATNFNPTILWKFKN